MIHQTTNSQRSSMLDQLPNRPRRDTSDYSLPFHFDDERLTDTSVPPRNHKTSTTSNLLSSLGSNASIPYSTVASSPAVRPLEFPAPTVDRAVTHSSYVKDHRSGNVFYATSVLMRRAVHAKNCVNGQNVVNRVGGAHGSYGSRGPGSVNTRQEQGHVRSNSRDQVHSWHSQHVSSPISQPAPGNYCNNNFSSHSQHGNRNLTQEPCGSACNLPSKAYCVRRKICDTIYGSVRLCVVLKRVRRVDGHMYNNSSNEGYKSVGEAVWETTDQMVAIKVVNWTKLQQLRGRHLEDPIKELAAVQLLGNYHPHVISLVDSLQDETHLFCVYPFVSGGDLYGRLWEEMQRSPSGRIDETLARNWFRQILSALSHLQKKGVCHRDLCMENMMVDEHDDIIVIDFGLCLRVPYTDPHNKNLLTDVSGNTVRRLIKAQGQGGKWEYICPEVMTRQDCDGFAIDLWSVGIVLFEFLIGKKPFALPDPSDSNFHAIAVEGDLKGLLMMKGISLDEEACDLLQKMLQSDPSKRLTLADVVSHPWVSRGYKESKPKQVLSTVEETRNCWFIQNNAIDDNDLDEYNLAHRLRINSCSSGDGGDEVTADSTDEESRNPRGSTQSIPYNISDEQLSVDLNNQNSNAASGAMQHAQGGTIEDEMLEQICTQQQKKKKGISSFLKKPAKLWKNHTKKTSTLTTIVSGVSSYDSDDTTSKTEMKMRGDGRLC